MPSLNNDLIQVLRQILATCNLSREQQEKVFSNLQDAIFLNFMNRLEDTLPDVKKEEFVALAPKNIEDVVNFFSGFFTQSEIKKTLRVSTEEIINKFLDKI